MCDLSSPTFTHLRGLISRGSYSLLVRVDTVLVVPKLEGASVAKSNKTKTSGGGGQPLSACPRIDDAAQAWSFVTSLEQDGTSAGACYFALRRLLCPRKNCTYGHYPFSLNGPRTQGPPAPTSMQRPQQYQQQQFRQQQAPSSPPPPPHPPPPPLPLAAAAAAAADDTTSGGRNIELLARAARARGWKARTAGGGGVEPRTTDRAGPGLAARPNGGGGTSDFLQQTFHGCSTQEYCRKKVPVSIYFLVCKGLTMEYLGVSRDTVSTDTTGRWF